MYITSNFSLYFEIIIFIMNNCKI